jgi:hypothetical protein
MSSQLKLRLNKLCFVFLGDGRNFTYSDCVDPAQAAGYGKPPEVFLKNVAQRDHPGATAETQLTMPARKALATACDFE